MSPLHLLWIIPLTATITLLLMACLIVGNDKRCIVCPNKTDPEQDYDFHPVMCSFCGKALDPEAKMTYSIEAHPACKECFYRKTREYGPL